MDDLGKSPSTWSSSRLCDACHAYVFRQQKRKDTRNDRSLSTWHLEEEIIEKQKVKHHLSELYLQSF